MPLACLLFPKPRRALLSLSLSSRLVLCFTAGGKATGASKNTEQEDEKEEKEGEKSAFREKGEEKEREGRE